MKIEKVEKLVANMYDKKLYIIHKRNSKQTLNHGLVLKKVHRVIKFNQEAWLKPYIILIAKLRKNKKMVLKKIFQVNKSTFFGKTKENTRKHGDIKIVTTRARRTKVSYNKNFFSYFISNRNEKNTDTIFVYIYLSILSISKVVICEFWYDYVKQKYEEKAKLCYMDTSSYIFYIKTEDIYLGVT